MGAMIIKNRNSTLPEKKVDFKQTKLDSSFIQGLLTCLLNPKAIMFIIALFSTVIKPVSVAQGYLFTLFMIIPALLWFMTLSYLLTIPKAKAKLIVIQHHVLLMMGFILISIGSVVLIEFFI
jgi:threonine/homoserine/homoserine lactone efflux protein